MAIDANAETHPFGISPAIIRHLIESQAGSIEKAVLEAIMNAFDANATRIDIRFPDRKSIVVEDNGRGFRTREEVRKRFGIFGFDHSTSEEQAMGRRLGRFGLGRGQLMAFGATTWESHQFEMHVDIRDRTTCFAQGPGAGEGTGLGFRFAEHRTSRIDGCRVTTQLYEPMSRVVLGGTIDEIRRRIRYVPTQIWINGEHIETDADKMKWTITTDELWFRESPQSGTGVDVYNLGVYVCRYPHYRLGVSGTLVSRPGHAFKINTARNDVLKSRCRVWKRAEKILEHQANARRRTGQLRKEDRMAIVHQLAWGAADPDEYETTALFKTVNGRYASPRQLAKHNQGKVALAPRSSSQIGERIHHEHLAAVLAPEVTEWLNAPTVDKVVAKLNKLFGQCHPISIHGYTAVEFSNLEESFSERYDIVERARWNEAERARMKGVQAMADAIASRLSGPRCVGGDRNGQRRVVKLGSCDAARAWTDGATYIALERRFVREESERGGDGWSNIFQVLVHEYMHEEPDACDHVHGPEFYRNYHDYMVSGYAGAVTIVMTGVRAYDRARAKAGMKMTRNVARSLDTLENVTGKARAA